MFNRFNFQIRKGLGRLTLNLVGFSWGEINQTACNYKKFIFPYDIKFLH